MRPAEQWTDAILDAALRDVALPPDLGDRLRPETLFEDGALDRMLARVAVPEGLAARLRRGAAPVAARAMDRLPAPAGRRGLGRRWLRALLRDGIAVALSLAVVATMFLTGLRMADGLKRPAAATRLRVANTAMKPGAPARDPAVETVAGRPASRRAIDERIAADAGDRPAAPADMSQPGVSATDRALAPRRALPAVRTAPVPLGDDSGRFMGSRGPFTGMRTVPDEEARDAGAARRSVPRMRGFDLAFAMAHGEPPFIDPSIAAGLAVDRPPLVVGTDSFDRVWPLPAGRRRLAEMESLRVEHLLAALSADAVGAGGGTPSLKLAAVRSLRSGQPTYLVEVCVDVPAAGEAESSSNAPLDATLVLDHSAGPAALPLWLAACRGLSVAADRMRDADRLTVIVGEPRPRVVAIRAAAAEIRRLSAELEAELPFGIADIDAAVSLAVETAAREGAASRLVVVAHADRAECCDGAGRDALNRWREAVVRGETSGAAPRFLLVSGVPDGSSEAMATVPGWTLSDPTALRRRLTEALGDRPALVAREARIEVRFDPETIAAYRLVGHRQSVPESLAAFGRSVSADASVDVQAGEAVRAVYEVISRRMPGEQVAGISAALTYREPSGTDRSIAASGAALDGSPGALPSPRGCELLLAVGIGELAGRSVHAVPKRAAIDGLRAVAAAWDRRGDVTVVGARLIGLLEELAAAGGVAGGS